MSTLYNMCHRVIPWPETFVIAFLCATAFPAKTLAEDLPYLRPGLWELSRSMDDNTGMYRQTKFTKQQCTDPVSDMKEMNEELVKQACSLSSLARSGDSYEKTFVCEVFGVEMESHSVLTSKGDGAYKVVVNSKGKAGWTTEELVARRLGDCKI